MLFTARAAAILSAAISMLLLTSGVAADVTVDQGNDVALQKRAADCDFAQWQWVDVDCSYRWDGRQTLDYYVKIQPTGQENTAGWCKGIMDNIKGECGDASYTRGLYKSCNAYLGKKLHHPKTHEVKDATGIDMHFQWTWPWVEGDDQTSCITTAIQKATCHGGITFNKNKCYKL